MIWRGRHGFRMRDALRGADRRQSFFAGEATLGFNSGCGEINEVVSFLVLPSRGSPLFASALYRTPFAVWLECVLGWRGCTVSFSVCRAVVWLQGYD